MANLTRIQANEKALQYLRELGDRIGCDLVITDVNEDDDRGYLFYFDAREWVEEKQVSFALAGNLPFLVDKISGEVIEPN